MERESIDEQWESCEPGTIQEIGDRLRGFSRAQRMHRRTMISAGVAGAVFVGLFWFAGPRLGERGTYVCHDVAQVARMYVAGELDEERVEQVELHLAGCDRCQELVSRLREVPETEKSRRAAGQAAPYRWVVVQGNTGL